MTPSPLEPAPSALPPFEPPGPGCWSLDTAHFPQPVTRFVVELFGAPARRGFREATARYGLLLDYIEWRFVHRWAYLCPRPVWSTDDDREQLSRRRWNRLLSATPTLTERVATSARVFEDRRWRADARRWDQRVKPALRRAHLELQAVDPSSLDAGGLCAHLSDCRRNLVRSIYHHHRLNTAPVLPAGDFLVHAREWTGRPAAELVALLRGGDAYAGAAAAERTSLTEALRADPAARRLLRAGEPGEVLAALLSRPGETGRATAAYADLVGDWTVGSGADVSEPRLLEMPQILLATIAAAAHVTPPGAADATADLRADVPQGNRGAFDELLAEARASHRLRDERAVYCDVWAYGLARRAILAAGLRMAKAAAIEQPEHLVEAGHREMRSLLIGSGGPSGEELAARARYRERATESQAPTVLGGPPRVPVPTDWLPSGAARTERAFRTYVAAMSAEPDRGTEAEPETGVHRTATVVGGVPASPGTYEGRARVINSPAELAHVEQGDVLVIASTGPAINAVLSLVGAIVTDRGGMLSHAAIVAREYGIPAVVGSGEATTLIPDGALVRVDGTAGSVAVLEYDPLL